MKTSSALFSEQDKDAINQAIASAESLTSGEIVPVVATASGRYDRAEDLFGVLFALILLAIYWFYFQLPPVADWSTGANAQPQFWPVLIIIIGGFIAGAFLATIFPALRLPFITNLEMREEVERRALETFQRQRIRATDGANGVLIYVSLYEHMVHVVGDDAVNLHITAEDWNDVAKLVVGGMKDSKPKEGLIDAIERCGEMLKDHFPRQSEDKNELNDQIVLLD